MFTNYLKIALRNIFKQKGYSFINITGLAIGMACCIFLLLWVQDELSFDRFHKNAKNLYRVEQDFKSSGGIFHVYLTPYPMGPGLKETIPEIVNVTREADAGILLLQYEEKSFYERNTFCVDPSFLQMFTFPLINGNRETALNDPSSIIISIDMAKKYFGNTDPMGKTLMVNSNYPLKVTGIMQNPPLNSTLQPDFLLPFDIVKRMGQYVDSWGDNEIITWVQLNDKSDIAAVNEKITKIAAEHVVQQFPNTTSAEKREQYLKTKRPSYMVMPILDLRLHATFGYGRLVGTAQSVYIITGLAIFILLIACINFINLATARSAKRAKEVGVRKVAGALRKNIVIQFFSESIFITFIALILSLIIVLSLLSLFNDVTGKTFTISSLINWNFIIGFLGIFLLTGMISGSYPALFLSLFRPISVLKGTLRTSTKSGWLRKTLVVTQFSLSIILLIGTIVIYQQIEFMRNKKVGYDKEQLMYLPLRGETKKSYSVLKKELLAANVVQGVSGTYQPPTRMSANGGGADWDGKDPNFKPLIGYGVVDFDYVETMRIEMAEGRSFSEKFSTDTSNAVLVNEEVVKLMGMQSAVGKRFDFGNTGIIIGVMKNYHYQRIQNNIEPLAIYVSPQQVEYAILRLPAGNIPASLEKVKPVWQKIFPDYPFEYRFFDDDFAQMFQTDERLSTLLRYAAILAIFVACLGLFGLASFMTEQRTKEIGIRKVLGATIQGVTMMLSKEFVQWVIVANLIAGPIAYFLTTKLLQNYAYRISIGWWIFGLSIVITLTIAFLTVSWQTIRAARTNPANSLKYE